jgi:predicted nucleic acid-binding protein
MILADTSVWIDYLRGAPTRAADEMDQRLVAHDVLMCGPVAAELLTGVDKAERLQLWESLSSMAWADIERSDWFVAGDVRAELRGRGVQVSLPDVLIASASVKRATLWTHDRAFEEIASVVEGLDLRMVER